MSTDFEDVVSETLRQLVSGVVADPSRVEDAVARRESTQRKRRKTMLAVAGAGVAAAVVVATPVVVLRYTGGHGSSAGPSTVEHRTSAATRYGERLVSMVELPAGGTAVDHAPARALQKPLDYTPLTPRPTRVSRWWTFDSPAESVWQWVSQHENPGLKREETVGNGFPVPPRSGLQASSAAFEPSAGLPRAFVYGEVAVVVASLGHGRSGVAVIATVEPRPQLPAAEHVPTSGVRAVVAWHRKPGGPVVHTALKPAAAARLARAFDALPAATLSSHGCPMLVGGNDLLVSFRAAGHRWRASYDGCFDVGVTRDGAPLRALTTSTSEDTSRPPHQGDFLGELKAIGIRVP